MLSKLIYRYYIDQLLERLNSIFHIQMTQSGAFQEEIDQFFLRGGHRITPTSIALSLIHENQDIDRDTFVDYCFSFIKQVSVLAHSNIIFGFLLARTGKEYCLLTHHNIQRKDVAIALEEFIETPK